MDSAFNVKTAGPRNPQGKRVMLVNGEPLISKFVHNTLQLARHEVRSVSDADEALALVKQERPDLVLIDLWLSGSYDLSLTHQLLDLGVQPLVVLSDLATENERKKALEAGAADYITLPTPAHELLMRVQMHEQRMQVPVKDRASLVAPGQFVANCGSRHT